KQLLLCTSVEGVLDDQNAVVREVGVADKTVFSMVRKETSFSGLGGMASKLHFAKLAASLGIGVTVFGIKEDEFLLKALQGEIGTRFIAEEKRLNARKKWRSEEHTSELQSRFDIVCRLLLEKKNWSMI